MEGLRFAARRPSDGNEPGTPMPDGVIRQWLVLGPVPIPPDAKIEKDTLPGESELAPDEGQTTAGLTWKKVTLETAYLDFAKLIGKPARRRGLCLRLRLRAGGRRVPHEPDLCRRACGSAQRQGLAEHGRRGSRLDLAKGWNRILLKVSPGSKRSHGSRRLVRWCPCCTAGRLASTARRNIAWRTPLPGVAGLLRRAATGWRSPRDRRRPHLPAQRAARPGLRSARPTAKSFGCGAAAAFEAAGEEDRKHPAYKEAAALAAKIDAINAAFLAGDRRRRQFQQKGPARKRPAKADETGRSRKVHAGAGPRRGLLRLHPRHATGNPSTPGSAAASPPATTWTAAAAGSAWTACPPSSTASPPPRCWWTASSSCSCAT